MFNNLIESSSHRREFKRRGSFFLFITAVYALLFGLAGIASIYAYDAHLSEESTELDLISYVPLEPTKPVAAEPHRNPSASSPKNSARITHSVRPELIDTVNPNNVPKTVGIKASPIPPARPGVIIGPAILDPPSFGSGSNRSGTPNGDSGPPVVRDPGPAPPAPTPRPVPKVVQKRVINSEAIELPKPPYPPLALRTGTQGMVAVQVLIDESGRVIAAHAVSGNPLLVVEAQRAAYRARFSPTLLGDQPVKVSGVITYNFVLQ